MAVIEAGEQPEAEEQPEAKAQPEAKEQPEEAGIYPAELAAACKKWGVAPEALLDFAIKREEVVLILPGGAKVREALTGLWAPAGSAGLVTGSTPGQLAAVTKRRRSSKGAG